MAASTNFYTGQWEEYHTHVMTTNFAGIVGVTEIQMVAYGFIGVNACFGLPYINLLLKDVFPQALLTNVAATIAPYMGGNDVEKKLNEFHFMHILTITVGMSSVGTSIFHIITVLMKTETKPACKALVGLLPIFEWWFVIVCIFGFTDIAWT